jgi:hypothetical protein
MNAKNSTEVTIGENSSFFLGQATTTKHSDRYRLDFFVLKQNKKKKKKTQTQTQTQTQKNKHKKKTKKTKKHGKKYHPFVCVHS